MRRRPLLALALSLAILGAAMMAADDDDMVRQCRVALEDRLFGGPFPHGESLVVAREVKHEDERALVRLTIASGEGRGLAGICVFRDGRLFDVK